MKPFRTELSVPPAATLSGLKTCFLTLGSCFSDAIGERLVRTKFTAVPNPFGVIYNPISIHRMLNYALNRQTPPDFTYYARQDVHHNHDLHSEFSALSREALENRIRTQINNVNMELPTTDVIIVTYGTAWVYQLKDSGHIVANCHKRPSADFEKRLLTVDEILASFAEIHTQLQAANAGVKIILTVSPVRHIKDTLPLNSVSKSVLRVACHRLVEAFAGVDYFPAYEIMMDDLRDYRFYDSDMIHPSAVAEEYIWERFTETYLDTPTREFIIEWRKIQAALNHRPFHPESSGHKNFLKEVLNKLHNLQSIVNVDAEINSIKSQLDLLSQKD